MSSDLAIVFGRLREILKPHADEFAVSMDSPTRYGLEGRVGPAAIKAWGGKAKRDSLAVAWVQTGKAYVSFHLLPVYTDPGLLAGMSPRLRKRMQGKACFNFREADDALLAELQALTERGLRAFRAIGFVK